MQNVMGLLFMSMVLSGCVSGIERKGLAFRAETYAKNVQLLVDETWVDSDGTRQLHQEIFDSLFQMIDEAERFVLLDFFLVNDFLYQPESGMRPLSRELVERLVAKKAAMPEVEMVFITDPINSVYGSVESVLFKRLEAAGVHVVWTNLDALRDSNPLYSKPWRLLVKPWGVSPGRALPNPLGDGRVSVRSILKLLNLKANHRKVAITDQSLLVTSANPHSASSAHWNVALRIDDAGMAMACASEAGILSISGAEEFGSIGDAEEFGAEDEGCRVELLTECRIQEKVLEMLEGAAVPGRIELSMFYLSDSDVLRALQNASQRGCDVRVILDPSKDAFGRTKNGIPNRQSAARLVRAGIPLRWADTHGEQFHVKMLYAEQADGNAVLLLGSCNFTRRNLDNYNAECDLALTAPVSLECMKKARKTFSHWWNNEAGRHHTVGYATYEDSSLWRKFCARFEEAMGTGAF